MTFPALFLQIRTDYGDENGIRFLVMERLGPTISEVFKSAGKQLENSVVADYGLQMLDALRECHERKVLQSARKE